MGISVPSGAGDPVLGPTISSIGFADALLHRSSREASSWHQTVTPARRRTHCLGLTNKLAFALIHDHDWCRVAHLHVVLPQPPERFMEGMRRLPLAPLMSRWQEADGARGHPRTPLESRERHYSLQFPPVMGHRRTSVRGQANLDRCH